MELYTDFLAGYGHRPLADLRKTAEEAGGMRCSSPDFIDPSPGAFERAVERMGEFVDVTVELNPNAAWRGVRVLSGQARPQVGEDEGIARSVERIRTMCAYAEGKDVQVPLENHYTDGLWTYPEFARSGTRFAAIVERIDSVRFGVNFDRPASARYPARAIARIWPHDPPRAGATR